MAGQHSPTAHTILVVEDEALLRICTVTFLEDEGYRVLEAANGEEALQALALHPEISLLVTDVHMPGEPDGLALAEIASRLYPSIWPVVVSGKAMLNDHMIPGRGHFIAKPFSPEQLIGTVRNLLSKANSPLGFAR